MRRSKELIGYRGADVGYRLGNLELACMACDDQLLEGFMSSSHGPEAEDSYPERRARAYRRR